MKKLVPIFLLAFFACNPAKQDKNEGLDYPKTATVDTVDEYWGTSVADPYRWLENDNSPETKEWVKAQNAVTGAYLDSIPFREKVRKRLTDIWNYARQGVPFKRGDYYFFSKNDGLQNQSVYYMTKVLGEKPTIFFDPNKLSNDGTVALSGFSFSNDAKYIAYQIARGGSDWNEIFVRNVETGKDLDDHLKWIKFSGLAWHKDGFFYSRYPEPIEGQELSQKNENHKVYYHKLGTEQSADKVVFEDNENPQRTVTTSTTDDEEFLFVFQSESTSGSKVFFKDLRDPKSEFVTLADTFAYDYNIIDYADGRFLVMTNEKAPRFRLVSIDPNNLDRKAWQEILPQSKSVLESVSLAGGKIVASYLKDVHSVIEIYDFEGKFLGNVELPGIGYVASFSGKKKETTAFYSYTSYTTPPMVYKFDFNENKSEVFFQSKVDFDPSLYETNQVFYKSKDGTKIPMEIIHKKGIKFDGTNPTLLYGYGGFNVVYEPSFRIDRALWLENGGIYVNAHIRGGGEYGAEWHKGGIKMKKQNVFDDFIAAAEYLIEHKFTSKEKLAILGGSNGGLLVGAVVNQRPDLFRVAFPAVGVLDMLRYHLFTIGWAWAGDYGRSDDSKEMFEYLYKYSPLHNIKKDIDYPAIMITTADHDDRVVPAHSFKYAAKMQATYKGSNPILIRIESQAGHSAGKPTSKRIEEATDMWSFTFYNMGITPELK